MDSTRQGNGLSSWTVREKRGGPGITVRRENKKRKNVPLEPDITMKGIECKRIVPQIIWLAQQACAWAQGVPLAGQYDDSILVRK